MSTATDLLHIAETQRDDFLRLLQRVVELESPTYGAKAASDRCCRFLMDFYAGLGFTASAIPQTQCGDHLLAEYGEGDTTLLLIGHYDTVYPVGTLQSMPWKVEGAKAFGPGVLDMKGGLLQAGFAVKALQTLGIAVDKKIRLLVSGDEEAGSKTSADLFRQEAAKSDWVIVLEPGLKGAGDVKTARKGRSVYKLVARGKSWHSGSNPEAGVSAIRELAAQIPVLHAMNDPKAGVTVVPTFMTSGIDDTPLVPDKGHVTLDVRAPDMQSLMRVDAAVRGLTPALAGAGLEILGGVEKPPLEFSDGCRRLFDRANDLAEELGVSLAGHTIGGGSDGNFAASTGVPTLDGMGMTGDLLHSPGEYINLDHMPFRTALLARLMQTL